MTPSSRDVIEMCCANTFTRHKGNPSPSVYADAIVAALAGSGFVAVPAALVREAASILLADADCAESIAKQNRDLATRLRAAAEECRAASAAAEYIGCGHYKAGTPECIALNRHGDAQHAYQQAFTVPCVIALIARLEAAERVVRECRLINGLDVMRYPLCNSDLVGIRDAFKAYDAAVAGGGQ